MTRDKLFAAIKRKCLECSGGLKDEVEACGIKDCPLFPYRMGPDQARLPGLCPEDSAINEENARPRSKGGRRKKGQG